MFYKSALLFLILFISLMNAAGQNRQAEAEKIYAEADALRAAKDAGSRRKAIAKYEEAILIFNELGMREQEAGAYNRIGYIYKNLSEFEKSLSFFEKSLQISREINNKKTQFSALLNIGQSLRYLNKKEAAVRVNEALALSRELGDREKEAAALNELGVFYFRNGDVPKSLEQFNLSAAIFEELKKPVPQAVLLNNMGIINRTWGNQEKAIELYTKALEIFREEEHRGGEADALLNLSAVYSDMFRTGEAMEYFNLALSIFRQSGNRQREAVILNNIGHFYNNLGDYAGALDYYGQSAEIAEKIGDRRQYATALQNTGIIYLNMGDSEKALEYLKRALEISRKVKNRLDEGTVLNHIGHAYGNQGDYEKAKQFMRNSLEILREIGNRSGEADTLFNLGTVLEKANEKEKALENYAQSLKIRRELLTPGEEARNLLGMARVERDSGDLSAAQNYITQAINKIESLRVGIPGQDLRTAFFSLGKEVYEFQINLLMQAENGAPSTENIARAFDLSERSRARSLLESLFESRTEIRQGVDPALLARRRQLQNRLNARERYRMNLLTRNPQPEKLEAAEKEIRKLLSEYQQIRAEIQMKSPNYAALVQPQPLTLKEIQQNILDQETVLFEYSLGEENSYLWIVTKDSVTSRLLPKRSEIGTVARRFYKLLNARNQFPEKETGVQRLNRIDAADKNLDEATRELSEMIMPDAAEYAGKRLLIVTEGILQYIPFGAMKIRYQNSKTEARYLIETNEIIYLPSASTLEILRNTKEMKKTLPENLIAVLADPVFSPDDARVKGLSKKSTIPDEPEKNTNSETALLRSLLRSDFSRLRFSRREAEAISSLVPEGRKFVALDFAASKDSVNDKNFSQARIIHFATHGIAASEFPELSGIVLSLVDENGENRDGFLRLHNIYNLRLEADLVVLSACETALGKQIKGEGIIGLTRGFMYAGASNVAASLWKVDDRATADLMKRFYYFLLKENLRPADALRKAQISMLKEKPTQNPYYWAPFVLHGDWK